MQDSNHGSDDSRALSKGPLVSTDLRTQWSERSWVSLREALETVGRTGSSSSVIAMNTVHRLVRTMSAWIQTLQARRDQLADEIDARERELKELGEHIARERQNAEAVAVAAQHWARDIESQVTARKADLQAESDALEAQLRAISDSLKQLPAARPRAEPGVAATKPLEHLWNGEITNPASLGSSSGDSARPNFGNSISSDQTDKPHE